MGALDIILVIAEFLLAGQRIMNVFHAVPAGPIIDDEGIEDLEVWLVDAYTELVSLLANDLTFSSLTLRNLTDDIDLGTHSWPDLSTGSNTAEFLPLGVAGLVTYPTQIIGSRGRKFIGGLCENGVADGNLNGATVTALNAFGLVTCTPFIGSASGETWAPGVVTQAGAFRPFNGEVLVSSVPAYQRRRKQGVGE